MKESFIIGSGRSLLELTAEEKAHINGSGLVLSFNKYLVFWEKAGLVPTDYLFVDERPPSVEVLYDVLKTSRQERLQDIRFFIHRFWRDTLEMTTAELAKRCVKRNLLRIVELTRRSDVTDPERGPFRGFHKKNMCLRKMLFFNRNRETFKRRTIYVENSNWLKGGDWAEDTGERLFHYRTTLTDAVNLAAILAPGTRIKLVGVDLVPPDYFYREELERLRPRWDDWTDELGRKEGRHFSAMRFRETEGVQSAFPYMCEKIRSAGGELVCCNPESLLVKEGILPVSSVI